LCDLSIKLQENMNIFWDATPCRLVGECRYYKATCYLSKTSSSQTHIRENSKFLIYKKKEQINSCKHCIESWASLKEGLLWHQSNYELPNTKPAPYNLLAKTRNTCQQYTSQFHKYVQQSVSARGW
jgi:hypothetical protein